MKAPRSKPSKTSTSTKTKAFLNRLGFVEMLKPIDKEESAVFILNSHEDLRSIDLDTVLFCLRFAENHGVVPKIPTAWWKQVKQKI